MQQEHRIRVATASLVAGLALGAFTLGTAEIFAAGHLTPIEYAILGSSWLLGMTVVLNRVLGRRLDPTFDRFRAARMFRPHALITGVVGAVAVLITFLAIDAVDPLAAAVGVQMVAVVMVVYHRTMCHFRPDSGACGAKPRPPWWLVHPLTLCLLTVGGVFAVSDGIASWSSLVRWESLMWAAAIAVAYSVYAILKAYGTHRPPVSSGQEPTVVQDDVNFRTGFLTSMSACFVLFGVVAAAAGWGGRIAISRAELLDLALFRTLGLAGLALVVPTLLASYVTNAAELMAKGATGHATRGWLVDALMSVQVVVVWVGTSLLGSGGDAAVASEVVAWRAVGVVLVVAGVFGVTLRQRHDEVRPESA